MVEIETNSVEIETDLVEIETNVVGIKTHLVEIETQLDEIETNLNSLPCTPGEIISQTPKHCCMSTGSRRSQSPVLGCWGWAEGLSLLSGGALIRTHSPPALTKKTDVSISDFKNQMVQSQANSPLHNLGSTLSWRRINFSDNDECRDRSFVRTGWVCRSRPLAGPGRRSKNS